MTTLTPPHCRAELTVRAELCEDLARWHRKMSISVAERGFSTKGMMALLDRGRSERGDETPRLEAWLYLDDRTGMCEGDRIAVKVGPMMTVFDDPGPDDPMVGLRITGIVTTVDPQFD